MMKHKVGECNYQSSELVKYSGILPSSSASTSKKQKKQLNRIKKEQYTPVKGLYEIYSVQYSALDYSHAVT